MKWLYLYSPQVHTNLNSIQVFTRPVTSLQLKYMYIQLVLGWAQFFSSRSSRAHSTIAPKKYSCIFFIKLTPGRHGWQPKSCCSKHYFKPGLAFKSLSNWASRFCGMKCLYLYSPPPRWDARPSQIPPLLVYPPMLSAKRGTESTNFYMTSHTQDKCSNQTTVTVNEGSFVHSTGSLWLLTLIAATSRLGGALVGATGLLGTLLASAGSPGTNLPNRERKKYLV